MANATLADGATSSTADAAVANSAKATADAAAKVAADKAAADKVTADAAATAAAAQQTPEQKAAAEKAATEKAAADKAAADKTAQDAVTAAAELKKTYTLKLPDGSKLDPALVERTADIASALGLDQKGAERLLDARVQEHAALAAAFAPPDKDGNAGAGWIKRNDEFQALALADKSLAPEGTVESFNKTSLEKVQRGLKAIDKSGKLTELLRTTGYGSHPEILSALAAIGRDNAEGSHVPGAAGTGSAKKTEAQRAFPSMYNPDGSPKAN